MPSFTKKAILESFLHIAAKKPLEKITVRDIVDECGINRNTFYYYFQDIYAVLEELSAAIETETLDSTDLGDTLSTLFLNLTAFFSQHPRAMRNILASLGRDGVERYLGGVLNELILRILTETGEDQLLSPSLRKTTVDFIRHAFLGILVDWVREGNTATAERLASELRTVTHGIFQGLHQSDKKA